MMVGPNRVNELKAKELELLQNLEEYTRETERLKEILGEIGGKSFSKRELTINIAFMAVILTLFVLELTTHFLPTFVSLELSVLLVSVKIVFMIHNQYKVNHFQFWILNSIEYRVNEIGKRVRKVERSLEHSAQD